MTFYTDTQRNIQAEFDSVDLANAVEHAIVDDELNDKHIPFIESRDFFFLSTVNLDGEPTVSYKGGDLGHVTIVDTKTLAFPIYDGNGMFLSVGNMAETAKIGMLFIDFVTPNRVRVQATANVHRDDELMTKYPGALLIVRAHLDKVFLNCARYIHKHDRVATSPYVPDENGEQPFPVWKRIDDLQDSLRPEDRGRAEAAGGTVTEDEYGAALMAGES